MYGYALDIIRALALPCAVVYAARTLTPGARLRRARRQTATPFTYVSRHERDRARRARVRP